MAARSFLGAGDIFINRMVDGVAQGKVGPIKADQFALQPAVETVQSTSKGRYDYGQVLESVNLAQPTTFTLGLKEVTGEILTMAFLGTSAALNEAEGTLADKAVVFPRLGRWIELGVRNLEDLSTLTNQAGTTTYVEGIDYDLNRPLGYIRALEGGGIAAGATGIFDGSYKAATGTVIKGSTRTEVRAQIIFDGINQADGTQCTVEVFEAVLAADSEFDFLADEFGIVTLTGNLKTPAGKDSPYTVTIQDAVV